MLDIKYYKDLSHNYLICKSRDDISSRKYQNKMITENKIKYLLPCHIKNINGETYFYYEITSKQSMKSFYGNKEMGYKQLYHLFDFINQAASEIKEYLLENKYLLIHPEYIYVQPEGEEYFFVYLSCEEADTLTYMEFANFIIEHVDSTDEKAVAAAYKIFEFAEDENFVIAEILRLFHSEEIEGQENIRKEYECKEESLYLEKPMPEYKYEEEEYPEPIEENCRWQEKGILVSAVLFFLCATAIIGILCIRYFCFLSVEESVLSIAGIIALIIIAFLLLVYILASGIKVNQREVQKQGRTKEEIEVQPTAQYMAADIYLQEEKQSIGDYAKREKESNVYGNTLFMEASLYNRENKLFGISKGNKYHIDLNKIPCTVGKMEGCVDYSIKDESVSRIHARFTKEGEDVYITDLNSTNGTFKNGLRLNPNETLLIEPGDEVRFGKMTFCYR